MYRALAVAGPVSTYFGIDAREHPALFVLASKPLTRLSLRTDAVTLELGAECSMHVEGHGTVNGHFHLMRCEHSDQAAAETFTLLTDALLRHLVEQPVSSDNLTSLFRTLARLFRISPSPDLTKERQGLWGELFIMKVLGGASVWCRFWHSDLYSRFDFSADHRRIEVKTTLGPARAHSFSHRQLVPDGKEQIAVASLMLRASPTGLSLRELIETSRDEWLNDPTQLAKLESSVRAAGMGDSDASGPSFDAAYAAANLAWYWAEEAPRFTQAEPSGVSNTHYKVDLSGTPQIQSTDLEAWLISWTHVSDIDQKGPHRSGGRA